MMKLTRFLKKAKGVYATIECKDNTRVEGRIQSSDSSMNMRIEEFQPVRGKPSVPTGQVKTIRGTNVRYVILPDDLPLEPLLLDDRPRGNYREAQKIPKSAFKRKLPVEFVVKRARTDT